METVAPATHDEIWTVYDCDGQSTEQTITKLEFRQHPELYHLAVDVWIMNSRGEFLIQRRGPELKYLPGRWSATSGSVVHGETSRQTAVRETFEELGLVLNPNECTFIMRSLSGNVWIDSFLVKKDVSLKSLTLNPHEVDEVDWRSIEDIDFLVNYGLFVPARWTFLRGICAVYTQNISVTDIHSIWGVEMRKELKPEPAS